MTNIFKLKNKVKLSLVFLFAIILTLGLSLSLQSVAAAVLSTPYKGVQLGNNAYSLGNGENLIWGIANPSGTGSYILLQNAAYANMFRIDASGNVTAAGNMTVAGQNVCRQNGVNCPAVTASQWTTTGANIYYNTGNVGIGTASPAAKLEVAGNALIARGTSLVPGLAWGDSTATGIFGPAVNTVAFSIRGTEEVRINSAGNVGVGTVNPSYKLDVAGDINFTGTLLQNGTPVSLGGSSQWTTMGSNIFYNSGNVGIGTVAPAARLDLGQLPASTEGLRIKIAASTPYSPLVVVNAGGADVFRVTETGRIGIGTANPSAKLTVLGSSNQPQFLIFAAPGQTAANSIIQIQQSGGPPIFGIYADFYHNFFIGLDAGKNTIPAPQNGNNPASGIENIAFGNQALYSNVAGLSNIAFGNQALYSNVGMAGGYQGINNIAIGNSALYSNTGVGDASDGSENLAIGYESLYSNTTGSSNVALGNYSLISNTTGRGNTALGINSSYINSTGGSNTSVGVSSLYVNNANNNTAVGAESLKDSQTGSNNTAIGYNAGQGIVTGANNTILGANVTGLAAGLSNNIIIADGAGNQRINVGSSGNVGIGTAASAARLDLGQLPASTEGLRIKISATTPYSPLVIVKADGTDALRVKENGNVGIGTTSPWGRLSVTGSGTGTEQGFVFADSNNAPKVSILNNGNVGIGTANPLGKLDVNGTIYQRGISLHADYVFEPSYSLETIENHAKYMWQKKHLPAVPSAIKDESGQDIVDWGQRNRGVLEELEKAHVYIQQLNERLKVLEANMKK